MRKFIKSTALLIVLALSLSGCGVLSDTSSDQSSESTASSQSPTPAGSKDSTMQDEGDIGDYHIKIVSAEKGQDYSKKDVIIVTYEWTNNSDDEQMFSTAFQAKAFQGGIECSSLTVVDGVDGAKPLSNIKPGATLTVQEAYLLNDDSDVEVEVSAWISFGNDAKVVKTFSVK